MATSDRCPHCGALVLPQEKFCAQCGGPLGEAEPVREAPVREDSSTIRLEAPAPVPQAQSVPTHPKTIEELKAYCAAKGMPLEKMRFFIDQDYTQPKAFGIYRDGDQYVVYKNKADGSRAVRYHGPDEAYAVNELFQKLLSECHNRGIYPEGKQQFTEVQRKAKRKVRLYAIAFVAIIVMIVIAVSAVVLLEHRHDGYYRRGGDAGYYYRYGGSWYYDDGYYDWVAVDDFPYVDYEDYYLGNDYNSSWTVDDFKGSSTWDRIQEESRSSSSSSDYDSWDSGGTDWDSDW